MLRRCGRRRPGALRSTAPPAAGRCGSRPRPASRSPDRARTAPCTRAASCTCGVGVDDDEPAHAVVLDDVDDALVGQVGHDEVGERAQCRVGLERARELLADRRQQAERSASAALGVVHASALERDRRTARRASPRRPAPRSSKTCPRSKRNPSAPSVTSPTRSGTRRRGRAAAAALGEARLALALAQEHGLAALDRLTDRSALREREAAPAGESPRR